MRKLLLLVIMVLLFTASCKKDKPKPVNPVAKGEFENGIWVLNEGNFQYANASVSFINTADNSIRNNVFKEVNGRPIGDVLQSMYKHKEKYYFVVNNSQKIEVTHAESMKSVGTIEGFNSPRHFLPVSDEKAYVTDLYAKGIWIVDLTSNSIKGSIPYREKSADPFDGWTEQMVMTGDKVFVLAVKAGQVLVIDPASEKIVDSVSTGIEPQWIQLDKNNKLWVLTNASIQNENSQLFRINPSTLQKELSLEFPSKTDGPSALQIAGDNIYYIYNGVYKMSIDATQLPSVFIPQGDKKFYGLDVDEAGRVFISDALDYLTPGKVYQYSPSGEFEKEYNAGMLPGSFFFTR